MEVNISDERMEQMVEEAIDRYVRSSVDKHDVADKIDSHIRKAVEHELGEKFDATVRSIVDEFMEGPVDICDGWGPTVHYSSYRDFFMAKLGEKARANYDLKREMECALRAKVDEIWSNCAKEVVKEVLAKQAKGE